MALEQSHSQSTAGYPMDDKNFQKMEINIHWKFIVGARKCNMAGNNYLVTTASIATLCSGGSRYKLPQVCP